MEKNGMLIRLSFDLLFASPELIDQATSTDVLA